jgi:hypothetical protein
MLAAPALGIEIAGRDDVELAWTPASGPVEAYGVFVSRDGGPFRSEQYTRVPRARVRGRAGESLRVRVRAYGVVAGRTLTSEPSEPSEPIRFVDGPARVGAAAPSPADAEPRSPMGPMPGAPVGAVPGAPVGAVPGAPATPGGPDAPLRAGLVAWRANGAAPACPAPRDGGAFVEALHAGLRSLPRDTVTLRRLDHPGDALRLRRGSPGAPALPAGGAASLVVYEPAGGPASEPPAAGAWNGLPLEGLRAGDFDGDGRDDLFLKGRAAGGERELWLLREGGRYVVAPLRFTGDTHAWLIDGARVLDRRVLARDGG